MAKTSTKVFVMEVMGRHAGWIAAAGGLARECDGDPPHLILFPEIGFDEVDFVARVDTCVKQFGYCAIVVSEGLRNTEGEFVADAGTRDAFGHAQLGGVAPVIAELIKRKLGLKYHWAVADYLQRAARHIASKTDVEQAYALGRAAVEMALAGKNAMMPIIERIADEPYSWRIGAANLADVANVEKMMPRDFITADGYGITDACRRYLSPLIAGEDYPPYRNGLPDYVRLRNAPVVKKLATGFTLN
jgi:6-phosphofructokinase 1